MAGWRIQNACLYLRIDVMRFVHRRHQLLGLSPLLVIGGVAAYLALWVVPPGTEGIKLRHRPLAAMSFTADRLADQHAALVEMPARR